MKINNKTKIKVESVKIYNIKNVKEGHFNTKVQFDSINRANLVGFYGQNGSGKTAVIDAFTLIEALVDGSSMNYVNKNLINKDSDSLKIEIKFLVVIFKEFQFYIRYNVEIGEKENNYYVISENLEYKENEKGKKFKTLIKATNDDISIRNTDVKTLNEDLRIKSYVSLKLSKKENKSIIFNEELQGVIEKRFNKVEYQLFKSVVKDFKNGLHIIDNTDYGLMMANILIPFNIFQDDLKGTVPLKQNMENSAVPIPRSLFNLFKNEVFPNINVVLPNIIPGLTIDINETSEVHREDGSTGVNFELLSIREDKKLPLNSESDGIIKIVSMLSVLSAIFKETNACVVIDELDSGIFEYLLGELLKVVDESARGQLIFTSHNLRVIELIPLKSIWFTTTNPNNRYIQLKYTSNTSNNRDVYIRALQVKNQEEELYNKTDNFKIKQAFRRLARKGK